MTGTFTEATAVTSDPTEPARYAAHLPPSWSTPGGVHGGMLVAAALRAALAAVDRPELSMRVAHAVFLAPPSNDVLFDVQFLRQGRGSAHVRVLGTCVAQDHAAIDVTVVFTGPLDSPTWLDSEPPAVPPPTALPPMGEGPLPTDSPLPAPPLFDHLDVRTAAGIVPWVDGWTAGQPARHLRWGRFRHTPWLSDGTVDPLSLLPFADLPGPAVWCRLEPGEPLLFFLSLDLSITFLEPVPDEWVLTDIRARWLADGHAYIETDLWSGGRLVATSTQTMLRRLVRA